jgi:hypothetical protein
VEGEDKRKTSAAYLYVILVGTVGTVVVYPFLMG